MINVKTLAIADAIGIAINKDISDKVNPVIVNLNSNVNGLVPLNTENYYQQIPMNTGPDTDYDVVFAESTTLMATKIRALFGQISKYAKPYSTYLCTALGECANGMSRGNIKNFLFKGIKVSYIKADHPFFNSLMYPNALPETSISYKEVSKSILEAIKFEDWDGKRLIEWIGTSDKEINEILTEQVMSNNLRLTNLINFDWQPFHIDYEKGTVNFTMPNLHEINTIFSNYILITKMFVEEDPFPGLIAGSLEQYRVTIATLYYAYTIALYHLKIRASSYMTREFTIVNMRDVKVVNTAVEETGIEFPSVHAEAMCFYNSAGLAGCFKEEITFNDLVVSYYYTKYILKESDLADKIMNDYKEARRSLGRIVDKVRSAVAPAAKKIIKEALCNATKKFLSDSPELLQYCPNGIIEQFVIFDGIEKYTDEISWELNNGKDCDYMSIIYNSGIIFRMMSCINCGEAGTLLRYSERYTSGSSSDVDKRKALTKAVYLFLGTLMTVGVKE